MPDKTYEDGLRDGRVAALESEVSEFKADIQGMVCSLRDEFCKRIDPISHALLGNGTPQNGLVTRFADVYRMAATNRWLIGIVLVAIISLGVRMFVG